jgi:WD repeat-containing protein 68
MTNPSEEKFSKELTKNQNMELEANQSDAFNKQLIESKENQNSINRQESYQKRTLEKESQLNSNQIQNNISPTNNSKRASGGTPQNKFSENLDINLNDNQLLTSAQQNKSEFNLPQLNYQVGCSNIPNSNNSITNLNNSIYSNLNNFGGLPQSLEGLAGFSSIAGFVNINSLNHPFNSNSNMGNIGNLSSLGNIPQKNSSILVNYPQTTVNANAMLYDSLPQEYQQQLEAFESASQDSDNLVLNYNSTKPLYGMAFQKADLIRLAVSTLDRSTANKIEILDLVNDKLRLMSCEVQEYPITKLMWSPGANNSNMLASSSDIIRLFKYDEENCKLNLACALNNKKSKYSSPLTSFDWNSKNPSILGTASIDTTCTIWDLNKQNIRTQLIAHDKEVFDIAFSQNEHVFISTGADGSIRLFDLRSLEHSTIMYETKDPISKIAFNTENSNLISAMIWQKDTINIIDSRVAMLSLVDLKSHTAPVTGMSWAPQSGTHICSVGEDNFVLIWNIESQIENPNSGPILSYKAPEEISNVNWCFDHPEWIAIAFKNQLQLLRV